MGGQGDQRGPYKYISLLVPISWETCLTVALETFLGLWLELESEVAHFLQVANQVEVGFAM
jgi:hypothetical protein